MKVSHFIALSLGLHASLMLLTRLLPDVDSPAEVAEIEILPSVPLNSLLKSKETTVVRSVNIPETMKKEVDDTKSQLTSEETIRVKKEMRAAQTGKTQNSYDDRPALNLPTQSATENKQQRKVAENLEKDSEADRRADDIKSKESQFGDDLKAWQQLSGGGPSTFGEALPQDMPVGSFTSLNTDRNTFYSFYARVEDLTRFRWDVNVRRAVDRLSPTAMQFLNNRRVWVTQVEFLLDRSGELKSVLLMKESGFPEFDKAAINAFKEARIFPNPPQEMLQSDGYIHLKYSFHVNWAPVRIAQPQ